MKEKADTFDRLDVFLRSNIETAGNELNQYANVRSNTQYGTSGEIDLRVEVETRNARIRALREVQRFIAELQNPPDKTGGD